MSVTVVHAIAGRLRLRVSALKHNEKLAGELRDQLAEVAEFQTVEANPVTGSVLLTYDTAYQQAVISRLRTTFPELQPGELRLPCPPPGNGSPAGAGMARDVTRIFERLNKKVEQQTGVADLKTLIPLMLVMLAAGSLILAALRRRKIRVPDWYDLIWFAFNVFIILNLPFDSPPADGRESASER
jgi:hypothetical protein